ncbi:MAG: hypothetical protein U5K69_27815 [Balneolaceae bacterium]|nr:hypothetical protein [Balneolaceae bacterium]
MFAYKKRFATEHYDTLPRYHITDCETRETYTGFRFANRMPVNIYCTDQRKDLGPKNLELCKNCHRQVNFYSYGDDQTDWFDVILKKGENRDYTEDDLRFDGYTRDWRQVSKAYRYKRGFICETCGIDLSDRRMEWFCEVHHIDNDKTNNTLNNLKCLCVKCHSNVDDKHRSNYSEGKNKDKLKQFDIYFPDWNSRAKECKTSFNLGRDI